MNVQHGKLSTAATMAHLCKNEIRTASQFKLAVHEMMENMRVVHNYYLVLKYL